MTEDWRDDALCRQVGGDWWFPAKGESVREPKAVCASCPVVEECREYAVVTFQRHGIWGGLTAKQLGRIRAERGMVNPLTPVGFRHPERAA